MSVLLVHFCTMISADVMSDPNDVKPLSSIDESQSTQVPGWVNELVESFSRRYEQIKDMKDGQRHPNIKKSFKTKKKVHINLSKLNQ